MASDTERTYGEDVLERLLDEGDRVVVNGSDVHIKTSTPHWRDGQLDEWLVARTDELASEESAGPKPGLKMLLSILFRPEAFLVQLRDRATKYKMSAESDSSLDLADSAIAVTSEELSLSGDVRTLWRYERADSTARSRPAFLHLHAGGFFVGAPDGQDNFLRYVADRADAVVFDLDYSLSPERKFPHAVNEAFAALRHIHAHAAEYGIDPKRIVVGGGSAGANLTAAVTHLAAAEHPTLIAGQILMNPVLGLGRTAPAGFAWTSDDFPVEEEARAQVGRIEEPRKNRAMRVMFDAYRGRTDADSEPLLSPWLATSFDGLPPALITTAEMDALRPEGEFYAGQLAAAGVPVRTLRYRGVLHETGGMFGYVPQAEAVAIEVVKAIAPTASGRGE
ncbi:alpha/beta hydrolase [Microbacterium hominis]|uniref:Alpha/beta hydrolase n=1 Tax=Microbacterium hominis TaxID=162426 RepID=A0A7D4UFY0_9MICO|nr:alpha/beta hydrolase [Microbacterium hominis]QKJ18909.1 alpha/beta hydrolase [Microbacterium hominis]